MKQDKVIAFLDGLSGEALKKEATSDARSETFSSIMKVQAIPQNGTQLRVSCVW